MIKLYPAGDIRDNGCILHSSIGWWLEVASVSSVYDLDITEEVQGTTYKESYWGQTPFLRK